MEYCHLSFLFKGRQGANVTIRNPELLQTLPAHPRLQDAIQIKTDLYWASAYVTDFLFRYG